MMDHYDMKLTFPESTDVVKSNSDFLSSQSQVFKQLISEASPNNEIKINDAKPSVVFNALQCLHTLGKSLSDMPQAVLIRAFARSYKMKTLFLLCGKIISSNLTAENIGEVHDLACLHKDTDVQYYCWRKIDLSWQEIFKSPSFYKCSSATIMRCVSRPIYRDLEEFYLWNALLAWGLQQVVSSGDSGKEKSLRDVVLEYLPHIRFLAMTTEELEKVFRTNVLTLEECNAIKKAHENLDITVLPKTLCTETTPRRGAFIASYISHINHFYCPKHSLLRWVKAGDTFYAEFTVNSDCFLIGFLLPLRGFKQHVNGMLEMLKVYKSKDCQPLNGAHRFQLTSHSLRFNPPFFIEASCTVCINVAIMENNLSCSIEPYTSCSIGKTDRKQCEEAEEWKSFYIKDVMVYF